MSKPPRRITISRVALRRLAIIGHVRMIYGGGTVPNGGHCELCNSEWNERLPEWHYAHCLLALARDHKRARPPL